MTRTRFKLAQDPKTGELVEVIEELTPKEVADLEAAEAASVKPAEDKAQLRKRQQALAARWSDPFDLLDDILARGINAVKTERDAIKAANPKPVKNQ